MMFTVIRLIFILILCGTTLCSESCPIDDKDCTQYCCTDEGSIKEYCCSNCSKSSSFLTRTSSKCTKKSEDKSVYSLSNGATAGIAIGGFFAVCAVLIICRFQRHRMRLMAIGRASRLIVNTTTTTTTLPHHQQQQQQPAQVYCGVPIGGGTAPFEAPPQHQPAPSAPPPLAGLGLPPPGPTPYPPPEAACHNMVDPGLGLPPPGPMPYPPPETACHGMADQIPPPPPYSSVVSQPDYSNPSKF